jgi:outer membrane lipoprotein-sorting protein
MTRPTTLLLTAACLCLCRGAEGQNDFKDEPAAHALYDKMISTMREADSLSFKSEYRCEAQGRVIGHATYRAWLKKPNHFRLEASRFGQDSAAGVIVGDGDHLWIYWPNGKPRYGWEYSGEFAQQYEKHRLTSYLKKRTPLGKHSIGHEVVHLGTGLATMTILDPSTFHGYTDSLQPYLDGVRHLKVEPVDREPCDVVEVSIMKGQRIWQLWLSKNDHLPRKLKQVIRVSYEIVTQEVWSDVAINRDISDDKLAWSPPEGWQEWKMPPIEAGLLKPGTPAPDFELASVDGKPIRLSGFRGNFVWLFKWRVG